MGVKLLKTQRRLIATLTLGSNLVANTKTFVDMSKIQPFVTVGMKSVLQKIEFELAATITEPASQPALSTLFLKYFLDTELIGPANFPIRQAGRGWMDPIWEYMQRGRIDWIKGADLAANATSSNRTWTQEMDFYEPNTKAPIARCWPVEAFKAGNAGLWVTFKTPIASIKGVSTLTVTALTLNIYAHVFDVPAATTPIPLLVSEFSVKTNAGDINPTPGIGKYLRVLLANSPVVTDNDGTNADDLSAVANIDYFGLANAYAVYQQPTFLYVQDGNKSIANEQPSQLNVNTGNKGEFRLLDPQQNLDGVLRVIPLIFPDKGSDLTGGPLYNDFPRLGINGNVTAGLPANFYFLCQRVEPRTDAILNATVSALTSASTGKPLIGQQAVVPKGHAVQGADISRVPLLINAS